jgi:hypothetical protein
MRPSWSDEVVYLIQGRSNLINILFENVNFGPKVVILTWDSEFPANELPSYVLRIFFPNSTWAEGRNRLLEEASIAYPDAEYFVFLDDDVEFTGQSLKYFEELILNYRPKIAVPLCDRIMREMSYSRRQMERPIRHDQVMMAFHKSVLKDGIVLPIDTKFDNLSWWLTCELNHYMIQKFYFREMLSFNNVVIRNSNHSHELDSDLHAGEKSEYKAKFTSIHLEQVKYYIEEKYGSQKSILDTIFQPSILKKIRIVNLNRLHFEKLLSLLQMRKFYRFSILTGKITLTFFMNLVYRIFWPSLLLSSRVNSLEN